MSSNMRLFTKAVFCFVFALTMSSGNCQQEKRKTRQDLETQASVPGYGLYEGLNNIYGGGIYGGYPNYYNRGYYRILSGLGTSGLEYTNFGYDGYGGLGYGYNGLGVSGIYPGYNVLGGYGNYYNPYGYYG